MASKNMNNNNDNNKTTVKQSPLKKIIKPIDSKNFKPSAIEFSNVIVNTELGNKWINTTISNDKILLVARGCTVKTFKKLDNDKDAKPNLKKDSSYTKKDKFQAFLGVTDTDFIKAVKSYDDSLITFGVKRSQELFDTEMNSDECGEMFKSTLSFHDKYGYAIGGVLSREFNCESKTEDVPDVSNLIVALEKNTVVDVCFWFNKIKLGVGKYSVGLEILKINIISTGVASQYKSNAISVDEFETGKITLTDREVLDKGAKKCKVLYGEGESAKALRLKFENTTARMFLNKQPGDEKESYSLSIRLSDPSIRKMIENIDEEIFKILLDKSKEYYDAKKTSKLLRPIVKSLLSYSKADQDKIKKGEKPSYEPSLWIKIYHSEEKGFDGKITNIEGKKPINNTEQLIGKDLNITNLEIYSKHIWFGPKGTSINFTLNSCEISFDVPEYDMDNVDTTAVSDDEEAEEVADVPDIEDVPTEVVNSDAESEAEAEAESESESEEEVKVPEKILPKPKVTKKKMTPA